MSIKTKLSLIMSGSVFIILMLNIILSLYSTQANLLRDSESKMLFAAKQIAVAVEQNQSSSDYVEKQIGELLRMAAMLAAKELDPDINNITNEQLSTLSRELGVTHISLLQQRKDDIIIAKSSDPHELGTSTRRWGYWFKAFTQLFNQQQVSVNHGQYMENFWTGPLEYSATNPSYIDKWGYYYDGKRNYIIDPFVSSDALHDYFKIVSPVEVLNKTMQINPQILEIACINPNTFGREGMTPTGFDSYNIKLANRPIKYGSYNYGNVDQDKQVVAKTIENGTNIVFKTRIRGKEVLKSFMPVHIPKQSPLVIAVVMNYEAISAIMKQQLLNHLLISLGLLVLVVFGSLTLAKYFIRPIESILVKVKNVAAGRFDTPLNINSKDEMGILSSKINTMTRNLNDYMNQLKQAVEENKAVKEHLESVIHQTADAIHTTDWSGKIIQVNKAFEKMYGWTSHEVIGKPIKFIPDYLMKEENERQKALAQGNQLPPVETVRLNKHGMPIAVNISTSPIRDKDGEITSFISVSRDMTERNRMEELLRRSEKLTTVGQLAAGVAHEIRNPLTTLRGFLQLQQQNQSMNPRHNELMLSELDRINLIVSEFLILAKPQAVQFQVMDVSSILGDVVSLLASQAHLYGVEFEFDYSCKNTEIHCEENQLKQVFINIIKNAMEAMPDGGVVTLKLFKAGGSHIGISIQDQGIGIPEDMMDKLGEPFFTNKENGTGLGLMVSQRIIEGHKGTMVIESSQGIGTKVCIFLPAAEEESGY